MPKLARRYHHPKDDIAYEEAPNQLQTRPDNRESLEFNAAKERFNFHDLE